MRVSWYPASVLRPKTVFTFDLLDTYHKISLQGKLNLYDFYNATMQKTDNYGGSKPAVGYFLLLTCLVTHPSKSLGTTRCRGVLGNGGTSRISKEVQQVTHLLQSTSLTTGLSPSIALLALIQDEICRQGGTLSPVHARMLFSRYVNKC